VPVSTSRSSIYPVSAADVVKNIPVALAGLRSAIRDENFSSPWAQRYREFALAGGQSAANPMNTLQDQVDEINDTPERLR
jgi:hypothetical protein